MQKRFEFNRSFNYLINRFDTDHTLYARPYFYRNNNNKFKKRKNPYRKYKFYKIHRFNQFNKLNPIMIKRKLKEKNLDKEDIKLLKKILNKKLLANKLFEKKKKRLFKN